MDLKTESPIEQLFLDAIVPKLAPDVTVAAQEWVITNCGRFRPDFIFRVDGRRVAVECDGRDFHNAALDEWRDAMILGDGCVDEIFRFRGQDLVHHMEDCLFALYLCAPRLFSERGGYIVDRLATQHAKEQLPFWTEEMRGQGLIIQYGPETPMLSFYAFRRGSRSDSFLSDVHNFITAGGDSNVAAARDRFHRGGPWGC